MYSVRPMDVDVDQLAGISYSGTQNDIPIEKFLFQLDSVAQSNGFNPDMWLLDLHLVLKDTALQWYWSYRWHNPQASWSELRAALLNIYGDHRTASGIQHMIEARKQHASETFMEFYQHMWSLSLQCHTPYTDDEFIQLLMSNMKPALQFYLTDRTFHSINDLIKSCTAWEATLERSRNAMDFTPGYKRSINELSGQFDDDPVMLSTPVIASTSEEIFETSVSAINHPGKSVSFRLPSQSESPRIASQPSPVMNESSNARCFNCRDLGHLFKDCSKVGSNQMKQNVVSADPEFVWGNQMQIQTPQSFSSQFSKPTHPCHPIPPVSSSNPWRSNGFFRSRRPTRLARAKIYWQRRKKARAFIVASIAGKWKRKGTG